MRERVEITKELYDELCSLATSMEINGREYPNPIPREAPIGVDRPPTLREQIQRCMRIELSKQVASQQMETFEEANDFNIPGDELPRSKYELMEDETISNAADFSHTNPPKAQKEDGTPPVEGEKVEKEPLVVEKNEEGS